MKVSFIVKADSRRDDLCAFLDSYAVELTMNSKVFLRMPVAFLESPLPVAFGQGGWEWESFRCTTRPAIDKSVTMKLLHGPINTDPESERGDHFRNPFFVGDAFSVSLGFAEQFWQFDFSTEKTYGDRLDPLHVEVSCIVSLFLGFIIGVEVACYRIRKGLMKAD